MTSVAWSHKTLDLVTDKASDDWEMMTIFTIKGWSSCIERIGYKFSDTH